MHWRLGTSWGEEDISDQSTLVPAYEEMTKSEVAPHHWPSRRRLTNKSCVVYPLINVVQFTPLHIASNITNMSWCNISMMQFEFSNLPLPTLAYTNLNEWRIYRSHGWSKNVVLFILRLLCFTRYHHFIVALTHTSIYCNHLGWKIKNPQEKESCVVELWPF